MKNESLLGSRISRYASLAVGGLGAAAHGDIQAYNTPIPIPEGVGAQVSLSNAGLDFFMTCLLYTSPSPRDQRGSRMPSSA